MTSEQVPAVSCLLLLLESAAKSLTLARAALTLSIFSLRALACNERVSDH